MGGTGSAGAQPGSAPFADPFAMTTPAGIASNVSAHKSEADAPKPEDQPADTDAVATPVAAPKPPLYKRRWFIITSVVGACLGIALLFIILFPVLRAIVQRQYYLLQIHLNALTSPSHNFTLAMEGIVSHTGIFSATVAFTQPVNVSWMNGSVEVPLGYTSLSTLYASNKRATINDTTTFFITDQNALGRFTSSMITSQNFMWKLQSPNLNVQAMKFPTAHGITFNKLVTINGTNNFAGNVILEDMQLPSDNPGGGIDFVAVAQLNKTSPFTLGLGTVVFNLVYQNVYLGTGTRHNTNIVPGPNNITLKGVLVPQMTPANLAAVSQLFTNYTNFESSPVIAIGKSTLQPDGQISWLSQGVQSLQLTVPFKSSTPINPIRSIQIGSIALAFTRETAWTPQTDSNSVHATMQLPFGFGLSINKIQNEFTIVKNGPNVAGLNTPLGASTSAITVLSPTDTEGTTNIAIANSVLNGTVAVFNMELTDSTMTEFSMGGNSRAVANMSIGQITLDPIKVDVSTSLSGLQGLKGYTTIGAVDVMGGTQQALNLSIDVSIYNPSNLDLATELQLQRGGVILGTALTPNLMLNVGNNSVRSTSAFDPNSSPEGLQTLSQFVGGQDVQLNIVGCSGSTQVASLLEAFESMNITGTLPGLNSSLLSTGALEILPTTFVTNDISQVTVSLVNPFTAGFDITNISSNVTSHGLYLGSINTLTNFNSAGRSTTKSPVLNMTMNYDPPTLFTLTRVLAVQAGLDPTQLDGIVALGDYQYVSAMTEDSHPVPQQQRRSNIYTGFNLPDFADEAFKQLRSDIQLSSQLMIGDYATTLTYTQTDVPISTDSSLNLILPISVESVLITNPQEMSFGTCQSVMSTQLNGSITNAGPFDAIIMFNDGLTISWGGQPIGVMKMDPVNVIGDVRATLNVQSTFEVANADYLANFTKVMLNDESFEWDISGENLTVSVLARHGKAIALDVHSTPGALKEIKSYSADHTYLLLSQHYHKMPATRHNTTPVNCPICDKAISRKADLPRHVRTHYKHNEAFMHACPFPNCAYKALQKTNLQTHIRTHTGKLSHRCPQCAFATTDQASLTRHRKNLHGYQPRARRYLSGKAARLSAAAPYPSTQYEGHTPASLDLNPVFPDLAGLVPCDALSPAESSYSEIPQFQDEFGELTWEKLFPSENFASVCEQPSRLPAPNSFQPSTIPVDFSALHIPQIDPKLLSDDNYQPPIPAFDGDLQ
ncbi:hypothetical protein EDD22DRAFT_1029175 [Suillus occidentalis]|nr:hypothetical protein EDD22DRAFT_1029175 [Suillus occidentalis]